jgi:Na+/H+-dicarboxylate symporter
VIAAALGLISGAWGKAAPYFIVAGIVAVALVLFVFKVFGAGKAAAKAEATLKTLQQAKEARNVENRVDGAGPGELERLRRKWER